MTDDVPAKGEQTSESVTFLRQIVDLRPHGEHRPQQETAVSEIEQAIDEQYSLLVEAPTGAGKTLSYLIPLIVTGKKAVISTATKQLSEQISKTDIPAVRRAMRTLKPGEKLNTALLKGRENYFCLYKEAEGNRQDSKAEAEATAATLFASGESDKAISKNRRQIASEIKAIKEWAADTSTGDRSDAPVVSDQIWRQFSATSTECVGRNNCPFGELCFSEKARDKARKADIVVTNHAVVGHDLMGDEEEGGVLGKRDVYVFDELHELDNYLSSAWGTKLTAKMILDSVKAFRQYSELGTADIDALEKAGKKLEKFLENVEDGLIVEMNETVEAMLRMVYRATANLSSAATKQKNDAGESLKKVITVLKKRADELNEATGLLLDGSIETVRWKTSSETAETLYAAPLRVGPRLQLALAARDAIMIGTSATIRVAGKFDIPVHNLSLDTLENYKTVALDSPFDYKKSAMLYIPDAQLFPAPVGPDRKEHGEAFLRETTDLVRALGGRTLVLSTTTYGSQVAGKHLRKALPKLNVLIQGEAPNPQLVEEFKKDETSVLVATMGMWHGLDAPGSTLSLVVLEKIPFKPMEDPLSLARQRYAESQGRNGFMEVYVAEANIMLAQGVGRLIRSQKDRGVMAILDTRLRTKRYGPDMLKSLPDIVARKDKQQIVSALERLAAMNDSKPKD